MSITRIISPECLIHLLLELKDNDELISLGIYETVPVLVGDSIIMKSCRIKDKLGFGQIRLKVITCYRRDPLAFLDLELGNELTLCLIVDLGQSEFIIGQRSLVFDILSLVEPVAEISDTERYDTGRENDIISQKYRECVEEEYQKDRSSLWKAIGTS